MPYIGNTIRAADDYRLIDDISSGFNGSETSFALQVAGSAPVPFPKSPQQVLISVNGVIQEPDPTGSSGFNLVGTNIVFSSAPTNGHAFFGIIYATADYLNAGGNFPAGSLGAPSITFIGDENTGLFRKSGGSVGFVSDATEIANFDSNGITISSGNIIIPDSIIHNGDTDTKIRFGAANTFSVETGGAERLSLGATTVFNETGADVDFRIEGDTEANLFYVDAGNNRVGIGTSTPEQIFHIHGSNNGAILSLLRLTNAGGSANTEARIEFELGSLFTGYIGQTHDSGDAGSLVFGNKSSAGAAPTEKMRINKSGNMAIGIISPAARLHIYGNGHYVTTDSGKATNGIHVRGAGGNSGEFGGAISFSCGDANSSSAIAAVQNSNDSDVTGLSFFTHDSTDGAADAAERMRIDSSGNIGIGTTSPDRTIHCHNSSNTTNVRAKFSNGTTGEGASDGFEIGINGSDPAQAVLVNYENSPMAFFTNGSERMRIGSSGRLFVGTTSTSLGSSGVFGEFCLRGGTEGAGIHLADNDANVHGGLFTF